jgi:hypothetical protein
VRPRCRTEDPPLVGAPRATACHVWTEIAADLPAPRPPGSGQARLERLQRRFAEPGLAPG